MQDNASVPPPSNGVLIRSGARYLRYRVRSSILALALIVALSPIWLFWSCRAAFTLISAIFAALGQGRPVPEFYEFMAFFYLFLTLVGVFAVYVCLDTKISFDSQNLKLPVSFLFELRGRLSRSWKSLALVDFRDRQGRGDHCKNMILIFEGGACVCLSLTGMKRESLRELIQAVQLFAPQAKFLPELKTLDLDLVSGFDIGPAQALHPSYTHLWEDELSNRFGSTIFVPLEPGARLQNDLITISGQLCFGGLSAIYLAEQKNFGRVILKESVLPLGCDEALKSKAIQMFEREAAILTELKHEHIAAVRDFFVEAGRHYIVLQHIEGIDLRRFLHEQGAQPAAVALRWLDEMADILIYLHSHTPPVVHRDVTPDNIVLARDGHLNLIDFGAANTMMGTATGTLVGKQSYISPEQFRGKASVQSDLYSLGATIYFVLTALDPEPLTRLIVPLHENLHGPASSLQMELAKIVQDLTEQDAVDRIKSSVELKTRIESLASIGPRLER